MNKSTIVIYGDYLEHVEMLYNDQRGILFTSILCYSSGQELPQMDAVTSMAFSFIRAQIDRDKEKYEQVSERRRAAGSKGGAPVGNSNASKNKQNKQKQAKTSKNKQNKHNEHDNEYDDDNDNVLKDIITPLPPTGGAGSSDDIADQGYPPKVEAAVRDWMRYKQEKRQAYKPTGRKSFLAIVGKKVQEYGADAVVDLIGVSMAAGWQGVIWEKLQQGRASPKQTGEQLTEIMEAWARDG